MCAAVGKRLSRPRGAGETGRMVRAPLRTPASRPREERLALTATIEAASAAVCGVAHKTPAAGTLGREGPRPGLRLVGRL